MNKVVAMIALAGLAPLAIASDAQRLTYCNPLNIDYWYSGGAKPGDPPVHHTTADPLILTFRGDYYLFSTNQLGYWWGTDMLHWHFVHHPFLYPPFSYDSDSDLCAPMVYVYKNEMYVMGSNNAVWAWPVWKSKDPKSGVWTEAIHRFRTEIDDPGLIIDDDGLMYLFQGSSNSSPINGYVINPDTFDEVVHSHDFISLHPDVHGWERFGEHNDNMFLDPFIEGAWINKHDGKYYLQYGAPGTEFSTYADGVYVSDHPFGPYKYQHHNPFSYKPGGFARGAGHGATFQDLEGNWWHIATNMLSVKDTFERRISMWPAGFDGDGTLYCNQAYGDYPTYLDSAKDADHVKGNFTGWMLLNYAKPVEVSSVLGGRLPNYAVDEDMTSYWSAASGEPGEWIQSDLGAVSTVRAIQVNYADQDAVIPVEFKSGYHAYKLLASMDGKKWDVIVNKSANHVEDPDDYVELAAPVEARYIKLVNVHVPSGKFAIDGLRVFGSGHGDAPKPVQGFVTLRGNSERRSIYLKWVQSDDATGYVVYFGREPSKLYSSIMIYGANRYDCTALDKDSAYYFQIEAFNENGISKRSEVQKVD